MSRFFYLKKIIRNDKFYF